MSLLDIKQAASMLGIGESTLSQMCRDGKITHTKIGPRGGLYRFRIEWIDLYLEQNTVHADETSRGRPVMSQQRKPALSNRLNNDQPSAMDQLSQLKTGISKTD